METVKKAYLLCLVLFIVGTVCAQNTRQLYIYHTNDMHSRVEPLPESYADTVYAGKAGMARRATYLNIQREKHPDMLLFDCGDFSQGTPFYNIFKGEVEIKMMNLMKYDAITIGNHEFDFGLDNMARLFKMAEYPVVCANYNFEGTVLDGLVKEYIVIERDGIRIGVFGLGSQLEGLVAKANYGNTKFEDPVSEGQRIANLLRDQEKCDVIICLSHLGWKGEPFSDIDLIENTNNIDLVLGGHSHSLFRQPEFYRNIDGEEVPLQQMGKNAAYVGKIILDLRKQ